MLPSYAERFGRWKFGVKCTIIRRQTASRLPKEIVHQRIAKNSRNESRLKHYTYMVEEKESNTIYCAIRKIMLHCFYHVPVESRLKITDALFF